MSRYSVGFMVDIGVKRGETFFSAGFQESWLNMGWGYWVPLKLDNYKTKSTEPSR